ncbi:MAG: hypothetical protein Q8O72_03780 [Bacteroidales bacterium]|nr:hypothetical protein [Bacteroidales bacterium]
MTKLLTIILTILSITVTAQSTECGCFNGIGSSEKDEPSLTTEFSNGTTLTVCGYEQEKLNDNEVLISEFSVFNCKTGESLVEYGAVQHCIVKTDKHGLQISELKFLPAGENWKWKQVKIGFQQIFVKENKLVVLEQQPAFARVEINQIKVDRFLNELQELKGSGELDNPEEILGRLEIIALNGVKEAVDILYNFENYFNYQTDGAIAEQLKDAVATVKWMKE